MSAGDWKPFLWASTGQPPSVCLICLHSSLRCLTQSELHGPLTIYPPSEGVLRRRIFIDIILVFPC